MSRPYEKNSSPTRVEGKEFPVSWRHLLSLMVGGIGCVLVGVVCFAVQWALREYVSVYLLEFCTIAGPILGVILIGYGAWGFIRPERLILGDQCYQSVVGNSKIIEHVPYANIADLRLKTDKKYAGNAAIALNLVVTDDPNTVLKGYAGSAEFVRNNLGSDAVILNRYGSPLEEIRDALQKKLASFRAANSN